VKKRSVQMVLKALNGGGVRYLVVGGLAVNAHGVLRFTADVDLAIEMTPENILRTFRVLGALGYKPIVPITSKDFADKKKRKMWIGKKNMRALQFYSDKHKETSVDILVDEPFVFNKEYEKALVKVLGGDVDVSFVSLGTLLKMKKSAGRPKDLSDIDDLGKKG
jgi:hypothetical protein